MRSFSFILIILLVFCVSTAQGYSRKIDPRSQLDKVYMMLIKGNSDAAKGKPVETLRNYLLAMEMMKEIRAKSPNFEPKEIDDILRILDAQVNDTKVRAQKDGLFEYKNKKFNFDQFLKYIKKEEERKERWERFQKWQEEERRRSQDRRAQEDMRRINEMQRMQRDMRRQAEINKLNADARRANEMRKMQEEQRQAAENRRRYEEQQRMRK